MLSDGATSARAAASRANGAKSKGPRTAEGKARSSQNALRHGLCGKKHLLLPDDSRAQFVALETALLDDLAPEGALQTLLAHRLIAAAWRLQRADRLEFDLFCTSNALDDGRRLLRDHGAVRAFPTLVRYRSAAQTEFFRTLRALEAVQTKAARNEVEVEVKKNAVVPQLAQKRATLTANVDSSGRNAAPNEPERPPSGQDADRKATANEPEPSAHARPARRANGHAGGVPRMRGEGMVLPALEGAKLGKGGDEPGGPVCAARETCGRPERRGDRDMPS
jgi:hypothetical protein